ncbi:hypothetical protein CFB39_23185 [Burkholderia sp. AU6039]|nr:hypothetical protein CFB39_23185 [Burkholderia sp. AU6039]
MYPRAGRHRWRVVPEARGPSSALKSLDTGSRVIYVGSLSKTFAPGLRLGYVVEPARADPRTACAAAADGAPPGFVHQASVRDLSRALPSRHVAAPARAYVRRALAGVESRARRTSSGSATRAGDGQRFVPGRKPALARRDAPRGRCAGSRHPDRAALRVLHERRQQCVSMFLDRVFRDSAERIEPGVRAALGSKSAMPPQRTAILNGAPECVFFGARQTPPWLSTRRGLSEIVFFTGVYGNSPVAIDVLYGKTRGVAA